MDSGREPRASGRAAIGRRGLCRGLAGVVLAGALAMSLTGVAPAQERFPSRPVKLVVGFPPGGANDTLARLLSVRLQETWGQPVVVENRPGANAIIATEFVSKAAPDGHTLLVGASGAMAFNPGLYDKLPYDSLRHFAPISLVGSFPLVLAVHPSVPAQNLRDFVALLKAQPDKFNYGSGSSSFHLATEFFRQQAGVRIDHVPYKGSAEAVRGVIANDVQMLIVDVPPAVAQVQSGRLRALAVTSRARTPVLPEIPTMIESGLPDVDITLWVGLFAPAGTPRPVVDTISQEVARALQIPEVRDAMGKIGITPVGASPDEMSRVLRADLERWTRVARTGGIKANP